MKVVLYSSPYVPPEWIAAHGCLPAWVRPRLPPLDERAHRLMGLCAYVRAYLATVRRRTDADAAIFTTVCDQMRRGSELISDREDPRVFLMNVPSTWQSPTSVRIYREELTRIGEFLVNLGGRLPSRREMTETALAYDASRWRLRNANGAARGCHFSEAIAAIRRGELDSSLATGEPSGPRNIPLAFVGGPLLDEHADFFDLVRRFGGEIVLDATDGGERALPAPLDQDETRADPVTALARAYISSIPDAFRRPNDLLHRWLKEQVDRRAIRGVIVCRYSWCDTWHAEVPRLRDAIGVPLLELDLGDGAALDGRITGRIQAFLEILT